MKHLEEALLLPQNLCTQFVEHNLSATIMLAKQPEELTGMFDIYVVQESVYRGYREESKPAVQTSFYVFISSTEVNHVLTVVDVLESAGVNIDMLDVVKDGAGKPGMKIYCAKDYLDE